MNATAAKTSARAPDPTEPYVPLGSLKAGQSGMVYKVTGGRTVALRLAALGILPGRELRVLKNWGPLILRLQGNRLALGRSAAQHILIARTNLETP